LRVLLADDDSSALRLLAYSLVTWGYDVLTATDGREALEAISRGGIDLAILDWNMPHLQGVEVVRRVREERSAGGYLYIILLTAKAAVEDVVVGLESGADDYLRKPYSEEELRSRIRAGERIVELERSLSARASELQEALDNVKQLRGLLPICMYCKKIRKDRDYWQQIEGYIHEHTDASFTHSICPDCREKIVTPMLESMRREKEGQQN
jgi:CheY-like chemotaxis protein